jgi:DNA polymerase sigma
LQKNSPNSNPENSVTKKPGFDPSAEFISLEETVEQRKMISSEREELENRMRSQYEREELYPWISDDTLRVKDIFAFLHNEILDFVHWIEENDQVKKQRHKLVKKIKRVVKECYPDAIVMVFGSCASGLNLPNSDIDLLVYNPSKSDISMINKLSGKLLASGICKSIEPLKFTKVPIIKL